nr:hypothetical protein [Tanacetum cinerariifolium]
GAVGAVGHAALKAGGAAHQQVRHGRVRNPHIEAVGEGPAAGCFQLTFGAYFGGSGLHGHIHRAATGP